MTSTLQQYTLEDFVKCRNQKEWVCDRCMKCGDRDCCSGNHNEEAKAQVEPRKTNGYTVNGRDWGCDWYEIVDLRDWMNR